MVHTELAKRGGVSLSTPIRSLSGVSEFAEPLARLGIRRAQHLLFHFPRTYQEPAELQATTQFEEKARVSFVGTVAAIDERVTQSGKHMLGVQVTPQDSQACSVRLLWFNQPFRKQMLRNGQRLMATGVLRSTVLNWEMVQPQIVVLDEDEETPDQQPQPVYPLTEGLKQGVLRRLIRQFLPDLIPLVEEVLPAELRRRLRVDDIANALKKIHTPHSLEDAEAARRRFKLQELLVLQLAISMQRLQRERRATAPQCEATGKIHARILSRLGYELTGDQLAAVQDIARDMSQTRPMNRLLQGDVGSGKTLVAQYAMLLCVAHGYQAALMAPTEVLATQHANTLKRSLASSRVRVELFTGKLTSAERMDVLNRISDSQVDLLVGTQALLSDDLQFPNLGLVIVDEQHKFGVLQRAKLRVDGEQPHYLVLSATPIPRTIAMTAFGDLDVSTIREKPPGRAAIHTYTATDQELESWWGFVEKRIAEGRQAYVIAPRVAETDGESAASALGIFQQLSNQRFAHRRVGLLHGRLESDAKKATLAAFASGEVEILVATTVVEVGIDVANATVMTILDADRLGLSQLHQLRGRVARGAYAGYVCAVASQGSTPEDHERLQAFQASQDGFELAELDLKLRGPGDLLGTSQSGLPPLRIADLAQDGELLRAAREIARELLAEDADLRRPEYALLRQQTVGRYGSSMQLSDIG